MASINDLKRMCKSFEYCRGCPLFGNNKCYPEHYPDDVEEVVKKWKYKQHNVKEIPLYIYDDICENLCVNDIGIGKYICEDYNYNCKECWNSWLSDIGSDVK